MSYFTDRLAAVRAKEQPPARLQDGVPLFGERVGTAKLSTEKVEMAKVMAAQTDLTYAQIGRFFGVSDSAICRAINGQTWHHG